MSNVKTNFNNRHYRDGSPKNGNFVITYPKVVPNLYEFPSVKHKQRYFEESWQPDS